MSHKKSKHKPEPIWRAFFGSPSRAAVTLGGLLAFAYILLVPLRPVIEAGILQLVSIAAVILILVAVYIILLGRRR